MDQTGRGGRHARPHARPRARPRARPASPRAARAVLSAQRLSCPRPHSRCAGARNGPRGRARPRAAGTETVATAWARRGPCSRGTEPSPGFILIVLHLNRDPAEQGGSRLWVSVPSQNTAGAPRVAVRLFVGDTGTRGRGRSGPSPPGLLPAGLPRRGAEVWGPPWTPAPGSGGLWGAGCRSHGGWGGQSCRAARAALGRSIVLLLSALSLPRGSPAGRGRHHRQPPTLRRGRTHHGHPRSEPHLPARL